MNRLLSTEIGRLRLISLLEGVSYLVLVGIAVPMKYRGADPSLVRLMGRVHGALFVLFVIAVARVAASVPWTARRTVAALVSSMLPFGAFWFERRLRKEQRA